MPRPKSNPPLRKGQLIRLTPGGACHTVVRTTPGAAYVKPGDWTTDDHGGVLPGLETGIDAISLYSFVYPCDKEGK